MTYGDPDIGGRPPRYQNWNAGFQRALTKTITVGATYAGSHGDFLGGAGRGFYANQTRSEVSRPRQPADATGHAGQLAAAQAIVSGIGLPYANFSGTISQMLRPFPQYSGVTDVYGNVAWSNYHSLQLTAEKRRSDDGLTVSFNYTYSRTEDNLAARTGYDFDQDWAVGVNDQPHVWNAMVVYNMPFGAPGKPGSGNCRRPGDRQGLADLGHHAVQVRTSPRVDPGRRATCPTQERATRISTRLFPGSPRINGDFGDGDVLGANPPTYIDRTAFQIPAAFTFGDTPGRLRTDCEIPTISTRT